MSFDRVLDLLCTCRNAELWTYRQGSWLFKGLEFGPGAVGVELRLIGCPPRASHRNLHERTALVLASASAAAAAVAVAAPAAIIARIGSPGSYSP